MLSPEQAKVLAEGQTMLNQLRARSHPGQLSMAVKSVGDRVMVAFSQPTDWMALTPLEAVNLAEAILGQAQALSRIVVAPKTPEAL